jgi:hypothetical protein
MRFPKVPWVFLLAVTALSCRSLRPEKDAPQNPAVKQIPARTDIDANADDMLSEGRKIFREDTFGSEAFWGGKVRLHEAIAGEKHGGVGPGLTPHGALRLGLKVDTDAVPNILIQAIRGRSVSLDNVKTTIELLKAGAVVGVRGQFDDEKDGLRLTSPVRCAIRPSTTRS